MPLPQPTTTIGLQWRLLCTCDSDYLHMKSGVVEPPAENPAATFTNTASESASSSAGPQLAYQNVSVSSCTYERSSTSGGASTPPMHTHQSTASATVSAAFASASNINSVIAKPNITPRPASLSGGVTRIAQRSSANTTKPPPPVRRSSSMTPSHNATRTGAAQSPQQYLSQYQHPPQQAHQTGTDKLKKKI